MRVKEGLPSLDMGRKRNKTKQTDYHNTSDEETQKGKVCTHRDSGVSLPAIKKGIKNCTLGQCTQCSQKPKQEAEVADGMELSVWLCLACGNQGCDRNSIDKHALSHFETPRTGSHVLAVSLANWQVWCYKCDDPVAPEDSRKLLECVEWIRKQLGMGKLHEKPAASSSKKGSKKKEEEAEEMEMKKPLKASSSPEKTSSVNQKVKGLTNLGNTCFFNAVMQNLTQTHILRTTLTDKWAVGKQVEVPLDTHLDVPLSNGGEKPQDEDNDELIPLQITLPSMGSLTSALLSFLEDMYKVSKSSAINPRPLFSEVCQKAPRFKGFQQQDSHELLRYLLDKMKAEQIKRLQEGILGAHGQKEKAKNKLDETIKKKIKEYGYKSKMTFVDSIFGGLIISSVKCQTCNTVSEILEPFLDISLPIIESKGSKRNTISNKNAEKPTLLEQAKLADQESDGLPPSPSTTTPPKPSKHQQQKAREKQRKDSKRKGRKLKGSVGSEKGADEEIPEELGESPVQSDDNIDGKEDGTEMGDPNDADSETSILTDKAVTAVGEAASTTDDTSSECRTIITNPELKMSEKQTQVSEIIIPKEEFLESNKGGSLKCNESDTMQLKGGCQTSAELKTHSMESTSPRKNETVSSKDISDLSSGMSSLDLSSTTLKMEVGGTDVKNSQGAGAPTQCPEQESMEMDVLKKDTSTNVTTPKSATRPKPPSFKPPPLIPSNSFTSKFTPPHSPMSPTSKTKVISSLAPRYQAKSQECSVQSCLSQFTAPEWLTGTNRFGCENCTSKKGKDADGKTKTVYTDASKQLLIHHPPPVLTLHLKRFQQVGYSLRKITRHIDFPLVLDIAPFCSEACSKFANKDEQVLYSLYGVVEHSGRLQFGHYTSFVKVRQPSELMQLHIMNIPRGLNLLNCHSTGNSLKKSITSPPDRKRHKPIANGPQAETPSINALPNGGLIQPDHPSQPEGHGSNAILLNHNSTGLENGLNCPSNFPVASGDKNACNQGKWFYISDTHVSEANDSKVLGAEAYILFYERVF